MRRGKHANGNSGLVEFNTWIREKYGLTPQSGIRYRNQGRIHPKPVRRWSDRFNRFQWYVDPNAKIIQVRQGRPFKDGDDIDNVDEQFNDRNGGEIWE
jgi:hypothetical protein